MSQQPRRKHIPERTCIVCREKREKRALIRIVRTADAGVVADLSGKRNGRGAYVCHNPTCWDSLLTTPVLNRALKTEVSQADRAALAAFRATHLPAPADPAGYSGARG